MNVHKNARLMPRGREWIVSQAASGQKPKAIAGSVGVCPRTARKWIKRHQKEGVAGFLTVARGRIGSTGRRHRRLWIGLSNYVVGG